VDCPLSIDPIVLKGMTTTILSSSASQAKPATAFNAPATPSWWLELFCLHRKFLLFNLIKRNLKLKYRQSYLGIFWTVLAPALNAGVYFVVFSFVMRVQLPHYLVFMFSGLLAWVFFSISLAHGMESIVNNYSLISKVPLPLNIFPFAETLTNLINYLLALPVLIIIGIFDQAPLGWPILMVPVYLALLVFQAYGFAMLLSVAYVYFRDLRYALSIVLQMWFYATPIIYSTAMIPEPMRPLMWLNPVSFIFKGIHGAFAEGVVLPIQELLAAALWTIVIFFAGTWFYLRTKKNLVERM
jgi:ABC-type polysaccharide/polyol phosphate export permease